MAVGTTPASQQNKVSDNVHKVLDVENRYRALNMETFHGLERFRDALDDYKDSKFDNPNRGDLRQDPITLSAVYSKAFGVEDKFASLGNEEKKEYQDKLIQAASNAYALEKDRNTQMPDFSYDSPQSSKDNEIIFYGNDFSYGFEPSDDDYQCDSYMCINNLGVSVEDTRLGRGQKYSNLWAGKETWNIDWFKDYDKITRTPGTQTNKIIHDTKEHHTKHMAMFKADIAPVVYLSDDGKIKLVGFAPDMATIKGTDCSQSCTQDNLRESQDIGHLLNEKVNPLLRDGSYQNDTSLQAVREGRDVLDKMATLPSNENAMSDVMSKSIEKDAVVKNKVLAYYDYNRFDHGCDTVYSNSYELTETPDGKYRWSKYEAKADIASVENPFSVERSVTEITKEQAMNMVNGTLSMVTGKSEEGTTYKRELTADGKKLCDGLSEIHPVEKQEQKTEPITEINNTSTRKYHADFSKQSGNSREHVEMIAVIKPKHEYYKSDADGNKKLTAIYVDTQVNNSRLSQADAAAGNGQTNAHLFNENKNGKFNSSVPWSPSQVDKLKEICGADAYTAKDGTIYIPLKADVIPMRRTVNGKQVTVGYMPNTKTIQKSDHGSLTAADINRHFENSKTLSSARFGKGAAIDVGSMQNSEKNKQADEQFS